MTGDASPLAGKRVVVTRAADQSSGLAEALEAKGAEVVRLPTVAIVPPESYAALDAACRAIENFDWLVFASANAVRSLAGRMLALEIAPSRLARIRVAAIGPATAKAAREHGLAVDLLPEQAVAESLVAAFRKIKEKPGEKPGAGIAGQRVLLARAAVARDVIPRELAGMGAVVEIVEAYRTVVPAESLHQVRALFQREPATLEPPPHAATFTSSSTVTNFLALLAAAELDRPESLRAVSIGPITTRTLREHNWEPAAEAASASIEGLVEACVSLFRS